jgi:site-specific DNA-methyltransferase (adenine-specific)
MVVLSLLAGIGVDFKTVLLRTLNQLKHKGDLMQEQYIKLSDLRKVSGIGEKTIQRVKDTLLQEQLMGDYVSEYDPKLHLNKNNIYHGDCLELMNGIPDKSIDMILCDLPYGTTACKWDAVIPFKPLWKHYDRIIKDNGAIVLFGSEPFSSYLRMSNLRLFKYDWIWNKKKGGNPLLSKIQPIKIYEVISIFGKGKVNYYPIMVDRDKPKARGKNKGEISETTNNAFIENKIYTQYYPKAIIEFSNANQHSKLHPTQKPVELFEYLIKTYTNEGDVVLDNCIGSGTTAIAAINTNRQFIGIEMNDDYHKLAKNRINQHIIDNNLQDTYPIIA